MDFSYDFDGVRVYFSSQETRDQDLNCIFDFLLKNNIYWDKRYIQKDENNPDVLVFFPAFAIELAIDFIAFVLKLSEKSGGESAELKKFINILNNERVASNYPNQ